MDVASRRAWPLPSAAGGSPPAVSDDPRAHLLVISCLAPGRLLTAARETVAITFTKKHQPGNRGGPGVRRLARSREPSRQCSCTQTCLTQPLLLQDVPERGHFRKQDKMYNALSRSTASPASSILQGMEGHPKLCYLLVSASETLRTTPTDADDHVPSATGMMTLGA
jgi:hypothetical protein